MFGPFPIICLVAVFATVAAIALLLQSHRKARWFDSLAWFALGILFTALFIMIADSSQFVGSVAVFGLLVTSVIVFAGIVLSYVALWRQKEASSIAGSLGVLAAMLILLILILPDGLQSKGSHPRIICLNNMRNVGLALLNYATANQGSLPPQQSGAPPQSWRLDVLPYLDQVGLHDRFDRSATWDSEKNQPYSKISIKVFSCPDMPETNEQGYPLTAFSIPQYPNGIYSPGEAPRKVTEVPDGTSRTLLLVEACDEKIPWAEPRDVNSSINPVGVNLQNGRGRPRNSLLTSKHPGIANVIYADGNVGQLSNNISPDVLRQLLDATDDTPDSKAEF